MLVKLETEEQLINYAIEFSQNLNKGDVVILNGELGAGKTTFVKGVAKGLKIETPITSPTYSIFKLYNNKLCHVDSYRVFDEDLGLFELQSEGYIICIEWASNIKDYIPDPKFEININYDLNGRAIEIITHPVDISFR